MDRDWLLEYLREALDLIARSEDDELAYADRRAAKREMSKRQLQLIRVVEKVTPGFGKPLYSILTHGSLPHAGEYIERAVYTLEDGQDVDRALGPPPGPVLRADRLHPIVWGACASLWRSNHRRQAVNAAAIAVNAALQNRTGRRDVSDGDLVRQAFSLGEPEPGKPRLRLRPDDGSETYRSVQGGAIEFGSGCFRAIRNPGSHEPDDEPTEHIALEQLAAFSILARWIEDAELTATD